MNPKFPKLYTIHITVIKFNYNYPSTSNYTRVYNEGSSKQYKSTQKHQKTAN